MPDKFTTCLWFDTQAGEAAQFYTSVFPDGDEGRKACGWLADRYGVAWQVVPKVLKGMMADPDGERADRVVRAMMGMKKMDVAALTRAYEGGE